ncbi:MAG TPA: hypothetical protein VFH54_12305 [Mycobacteriales bacterium]|nr:hypothetical protein [Mycobacteriales bacterium]
MISLDGFDVSPANYSQTQYQYEGSSSFIVTQNSAVCSTDDHGASAWSMIAENDGASGCGWAQSGYITFPGQSPEYFAQSATDGCVTSTTYYTSPAVGSKHAYRSLWVPACSCIQMSVDSLVLESTSFNPKSNWPWPWQPQFFGETGFHESNVPGTPSAQTNYSAIGVQRTADNTLVAIPCIMERTDQYSTRYADVGTSGICDAFAIYTF